MIAVSGVFIKRGHTVNPTIPWQSQRKLIPSLPFLQIRLRVWGAVACVVGFMIGLHDDTDSALPPAPPPSRAPELAAKLFAEGGWLQEGLQLEHRPQQEQMARATAQSMDLDEPLLFEAGTGVGKSLAYLLPGIIHAVDQSRQLLVSTHTISLQEQVQTKDLPLCRRVFRSQPELEPYADFKSAVLVGKANYLCPTRLATALRDRQELFSTPESDELQRIATWAAQTTDGLRHELSPAPAPRSLGMGEL